ncbi:MAG: membrane integrity-associated transporter subunit PqiC, partial [Leptothrix sp. (in: b-proteobacteria)]
LVLPLAGCVSRSPTTQWLRLPLVAGHAVDGVPTTAPSARVPTQLLPVTLPDYLDRDPVWVGSGATVQPLGAWRWAEALRDSVPRLLQQDLAQQLGEDAIWTRPPPPSLRAARSLRVELLAFEALRDGPAAGQVVLQARWTVLPPAASAQSVAPVVRAMRFSAPWAAGSTGSADGAEALAVAHRQVLQQLAARIADDLR